MGWVFVYYYAHLRGPIETWRKGLDDGRERLPGLLRSAAHATSDDIQAYGSDVVLGAVQTMEVGWLAPIELRVPGLFRDMIGDLRLDPIDLVTTRVTLRASYAPADAHREETHRRMETLIKRFVDSLDTLTVETDGHSTRVQ